MNNKFDSVLKDLENINKESIVDVYVPSTKSYKKFKPINVLQQKRVIGSINNDPLDSVTLINVLNNIIIDNCCDDASSITVLDREFALLSLKIDKALQEDIQDITQQVREKDIDDLLRNECSFRDAIQVKIQIPTLDRDIQFNEWFLEANKNKKQSSASIAANFFVLEVAKCIKSIAVKDEIVDFYNEMKIDDIIKIVEQLPVSINNDVAKFIANGKEMVESLFVRKNISTQSPLF